MILDLVIVAPHGGGDRVFGHLAHTLVDVVHDGLAVDRISDCPAHVDVLPERLGMVERQVTDVHPWL